MTAPQVTSQSSSERSETQFSGASFLSGVGSAFSGAPSSAAKLRLWHFSIIIFVVSVTEHHGSVSNQVLRETLVDATHRCRASIRTLNGPFWARCKLGFDRKPRSITIVTNLGLLGAAIYRAILNRPAIETQSPEQGGGYRRLPKFPDNPWLWRHQLMSAPLVLPSTAIAPTRPLGFDGVFPGWARLGR